MAGTGGTAEREFAALYDLTHRRVLAYCLRRSATRADALDAAADTFLVAWRRFGEVPEGDAAILWLFGVARRVLANQRRGQGRQANLVMRLPRDRDDHHTPDEVAVQAEEERDVLLALERLSPADRELLRLDAWERLTGRELAEICGCSEDAVKVRLHRARRRLAKEFERAGRTRLRSLRVVGGMSDA